MSEMVGKVSLQEKIAELESRVAALEKDRTGSLRQAKADCDAAWKSTTLYQHMSTAPSGSAKHKQVRSGSAKESRGDEPRQ